MSKKVLVTTEAFAAFLLKLNSEMSLENKAIRRRKIFSILQSVKIVQFGVVLANM